MKVFIKLLVILMITSSVNAQNTVGPIEDYSPQVGTLVSMLNDMKNRVERTVKDLSVKELDFLLDDKANRIGALIMHLAAKEKFYKVYTFEGREFNEEEEEEWGMAMNLCEEARDKYQGHDVQYYLDAYTKVRNKTMELMKQKDDAWLAEINAAGNMNFHWAWYHVMEHQSSHLGQILLLKKRMD